MRRIVFPASLLVFVGLSAGCGGELICTDELHVAVRVHISSPDAQPVDRVTADNRKEETCESMSIEADASAPDSTYRCNEQGGGDYTIRVYSGAAMWSAHIEVEANECHTVEIQDVDVVLDPNIADDV
jgi:hypothetical protein